MLGLVCREPRVCQFCYCCLNVGCCSMLLVLLLMVLLSSDCLRRCICAAAVTSFVRSFQITFCKLPLAAISSSPHRIRFILNDSMRHLTPHRHTHHTANACRSQRTTLRSPSRSASGALSLLSLETQAAGVVLHSKCFALCVDTLHSLSSAVRTHSRCVPPPNTHTPGSPVNPTTPLPHHHGSCNW